MLDCGAWHWRVVAPTTERGNWAASWGEPVAIFRYNDAHPGDVFVRALADLGPYRLSDPKGLLMLEAVVNPPQGGIAMILIDVTEVLSEAAGEVRAIEWNADQILSVVRYLENAESAQEVRDAANTLNAAINYLSGIVRDLEDIARRAEDIETQTPDCPECGCTVEDADAFSGYCSAHCKDINN